MKAAIGDHLVILPQHVGGPVRDCRVISLTHSDGSPPYVVEWADGRQGLIFPGTNTRVERAITSEAPTTGPPVGSVGLRDTATGSRWTVTIEVSVHGADATARAVLDGEHDGLSAWGNYRQGHGEPVIEGIAGNVAVSRALRALADNLVAAAATNTCDIRVSRLHDEAGTVDVRN